MELTQKRCAHTAAKHVSAKRYSHSVPNYTSMWVAAAIMAALTLVASYFLCIALIDGFHELLRQLVIHTANPFGWS